MSKTLTVSLNYELLDDIKAREATLYAVRHIRGVESVDDALARNGLVFVDIGDEEAIEAISMINGVRTVRCSDEKPSLRI